MGKHRGVHCGNNEHETIIVNIPSRICLENTLNVRFKNQTRPPWKFLLPKFTSISTMAPSTPSSPFILPQTPHTKTWFRLDGNCKLAGKLFNNIYVLSTFLSHWTIILTNLFLLHHLQRSFGQFLLLTLRLSFPHRTRFKWPRVLYISLQYPSLLTILLQMIARSILFQYWPRKIWFTSQY